MAVEDQRGVVRRRWPVVLVGLIVTVVLGLLTLRMPGVYWASTKVVFLVPASEQGKKANTSGYGNALQCPHGTPRVTIFIFTIVHIRAKPRLDQSQGGDRAPKRQLVMHRSKKSPMGALR